MEDEFQIGFTVNTAFRFGILYNFQKLQR